MLITNLSWKFKKSQKYIASSHVCWLFLLYFYFIIFHLFHFWGFLARASYHYLNNSLLSSLTSWWSIQHVTSWRHFPTETAQITLDLWWQFEVRLLEGTSSLWSLTTGRKTFWPFFKFACSSCSFCYFKCPLVWLGPVWSGLNQQVFRALCLPLLLC